jgi:hypothetical protein
VPGRVERLRDRCGEVDDWAALVRMVGDLRIRPLVHQHLREIAADLVPDPALAELAVAARQDVLRNLQTAEVHIRLHRDILAPMGVPHVFVKGTTLAHRFYAQPNLRVARDVDVLVPEGDLERIAHTLRDLGYRAKWPQFGTDDGIAFAARVVGGMDWVSPDEILIEVHSTLKYQAGRLPTARLLADAVDVTVAGRPLPALSLADTVSHLCLHHTRSSWTRMSWVADLDAMLRATGADRASLVATAHTRGFGRVVAASLGLHRALARPDPAAPLSAPLAAPLAATPTAAAADPDVTLTAELLDVCLTGLARIDAPLGAPASVPVRRRSSQVAYADLAPLHRRRLRVLSSMGRFRRQSADFLRLPLPKRLHWAYLLLRPVLRLVHGRFGLPEGER